MKVCAITGHRPGSFSFGYDETAEECRMLKKRIYDILTALYRTGVRQFYVGGAQGVDMWAGELIVQMMQDPEYVGIKLVLAVPFAHYEQKWRTQDKQRLYRLIELCSETVTVGFVNSSQSYLQRNRYMVDRADCLFAVYDGMRSSHSGTCFTVEYAASQNIPIWMLDPETLELTVI